MIPLLNIANIIPSYEEYCFLSLAMLSSQLAVFTGGVRHNSKVPCEGASLYGDIYRYIYIYKKSIATLKKEMFHTGGYTDARVLVKAANSSIAD